MLFYKFKQLIPLDSRLHLTINGKGCFYGTCIALEDGYNGDKKVVDVNGVYQTEEYIRNFKVVCVSAYRRNVLKVDLRGEIK